mmetsp:Transcript_7613/g.14906  ORF Transcript_7613/g.14906 Transcript_7613/m.14906 type:complete len:88 (-) Transcript_7613:575-838(-)
MQLQALSPYIAAYNALRLSPCWRKLREIFAVDCCINSRTSPYCYRINYYCLLPNEESYKKTLLPHCWQRQIELPLLYSRYQAEQARN